MIQPQPFKYVCPKCGYSRVVKLKSDVIATIDMLNICSKCHAKMEQKELNIFDNLKSIFK